MVFPFFLELLGWSIMVNWGEKSVWQYDKIQNFQGKAGYEFIILYLFLVKWGSEYNKD